MGPDPDYHPAVPPDTTGPTATDLTAAARAHRLDGLFRYASGAPYSSHLIGLAPVAGNGAGGPRALLVPRAAYTLLDAWDGDQILGMAASGSQTVRLDGLSCRTPHDPVPRLPV